MNSRQALYDSQGNGAAVRSASTFVKPSEPLPSAFFYGRHSIYESQGGLATMDPARAALISITAMPDASPSPNGRHREIETHVIDATAGAATLGVNPMVTLRHQNFPNGRHQPFENHDLNATSGAASKVMNSNMGLRCRNNLERRQ